MEPVEDLSESLKALLEDIVSRRGRLDRQGQKLLLDNLRKLLIATKGLAAEMKTLTEHQTCPPPCRPKLYLVQ